MAGIIDEFGKWLESEYDKEQDEICRQRRDCYDCPYEPKCSESDLLDGLEDW